MTDKQPLLGDVSESAPSQQKMEAKPPQPQPYGGLGGAVSEFGFSVLSTNHRIEVSEQRDLIEALTGWEDKKRYVVKDKSGEVLFYVKEETSFCHRNCVPPDCANWKAEVYIPPQATPPGALGAGQLGEVLTMTPLRRWLHLDRPSQCTFFCLNRPELFITDLSTGELLGKATNPFECCDIPFSVKDSTSNETVFKTRGNCCQLGVWCPLPCGPCKDVDFTFIDKKTGNPVARIEKQWSCGDFCHLCFDEWGKYWIDFEQQPSRPELSEQDSSRWRALTLMTALFMHIRYFSSRQQQQNDQNNAAGVGGAVAGGIIGGLLRA